MGQLANRPVSSERGLQEDRTVSARTDLGDARAAVLGWAGFLGGHLIRELFRQNVVVVVVDNLTTGHDLFGVLDHPSVTFIRDDIVEPFDVDGGGSSDIEFVDRPVDDPSVRRPDLRLARTALGWEAQIDLEEGVAMSFPWFAAALAQEHRVAVSQVERQAG